MDSYRGDFGEYHGMGSDHLDPADDDIGHEPPPMAIGSDERRLQVRAYNHWASLLRDRPYPAIADLATGSLGDFDPYSVLLDFSNGIENPAIRYLGGALAAECGLEPQAIRTLADVPSRSLLSRITDHYLQIHANQAPIGFEAEFVNAAGTTILYRGILLPFSGNDESHGIDRIYGVINWKELADQATTDALLDEIDRALEARPVRQDMPITEWADGPADGFGDVLELVTPLDEGDNFDWPAPEFGTAGSQAGLSLADWLASARELARAAQGSEDRTRQALYAAIGRAWDFALATRDHPAAFREMLDDSGLTMQDRAPFTPVVKLVFGAACDKTRLTEYAAALSHAQRHNIASGDLEAVLARAPGGLKGVVNAERRLRREESGKPVSHRESAREALTRRLRGIDAQPLAGLSSAGEEFAVVVVRRTPEGRVLLVGELDSDSGLLERAAKHLIA